MLYLYRKYYEAWYVYKDPDIEQTAETAETVEKCGSASVLGF